MASTKSRVHPKYKTKYRVGNGSDYDRSLVERGNLTVWLSPDAIAQWNAKPSRRRGGQHKYSDLAIETALTLRPLFSLPLRQVEGFLCSLFDLMGLVLDVPDHTTLSRRGKVVKAPIRVPQKSGRIDLVIGGLNTQAALDLLTASESSQRDSAESRFHDGTSVKAQQAPGALLQRGQPRTTSRTPRTRRDFQSPPQNHKRPTQ